MLRLLVLWVGLILLLGIVRWGWLLLLLIGGLGLISGILLRVVQRLLVLVLVLVLLLCWNTCGLLRWRGPLLLIPRCALVFWCDWADGTP